MALAKASNISPHGFDDARVRALWTREVEAYEAAHPKAKACHLEARKTMLHGVPLHWMSQWPGPFPLVADRGRGAELTDIDGHRYADFCLGDSGAFFGHANEHVARAIARFATERGSTMMLPSEDAVAVSGELSRRFGLPYWQFTTSATDANRFAVRMARMITARDLILVFNGKYHGSVDETQVEIDQGRMVPQHGIHPNGMNHEATTRIVEYNDIEALTAALEDRKVACVLAEPMLTNIGMVPPAPGFNEALREITRRTGTLLILDETHTICAGPAGCTGEWGLEPDILTLGKVLAGGIPSAVWGVSADVGAAIERHTGADGINHYGFGGTLAGNALTLHAMRVTLEKVMTPENYARMCALAGRLEEGVAERIAGFGLPWHVTRIGARVEFLYMPDVPRNGGEAACARDDAFEALIHIYFLNRGILLSPFHNMALIAPQTQVVDVDLYLEVFDAYLRELAR
ncbi:MAG: aspartate aminotransferase family protein [Parvibaculum sp.]